ncbi:Solute carrier family 12 member 8 [Bagarius yarrelli]|uniref:Solute carrier family 12 member 8 n=1 Tax=Bagarius yarrelli TaxID=175774 RepID=A0A556TW58_BAGYA|nr:Solute carrier family 12 member 8 [Bagarius yarrelli]
MSTHVQELFHENAQGSQMNVQPWWKVNLFLWEPVLFGTWDGVFTTCMINIFGVVLFLRTGWLVGNTGVLLGMLLVSLVVLVALVTVISGVGVCERCTVGNGGVYAMISMVLGGRVGGTVGLLYVFGQCVAGAMYATGFAESIADLLTVQSVWAVRGISVAVLLALLGINLAGVKWIVRLQLILLAILAVSTLDFVIGTFSHLDPGRMCFCYVTCMTLAATPWFGQEIVRAHGFGLLELDSPTYLAWDESIHMQEGDLSYLLKASRSSLPEHGFVGYSEEVLWTNTLPDYTAGETFFTVFGVFFPAATGVMAGFNMSSDLRKPEHSIPVGTLAAVFTSWFLYLVFVFLLGAICTRDALRYDFLIAEKVSLVGFLFLLGLYVSSLASCMGGLYGAPRVLQCIAQERVIPALSFLGQGKGPNKTPIAAICLTSLISMAFIFIGQVNILAPIVTINFMLTYSVIDYSYFSVAMSYKLQDKERRPLIKKPSSRKSLVTTSHTCYGSNGALSKPSNGTLLEFTKDMDQIFTLPSADSTEEEKASNNVAKVWGRKAKVPAKETLSSSFGLDLNSNSPSEKEKDEKVLEQNIGPDDETSSQTGLNESEPAGKRKLSLSTQSPIELYQIPRETSDTNDAKSKLEESDIRPIPNSCYAKFCNHWVSLIGALCSILIMFVIQWVYALVNISVALLLYLYIGNTSPGLPTGIAARFSFFHWIKSSLRSLGRTHQVLQNQVVVTPSLSVVDMETRQLTEENTDFAFRDRYHHSSVITTKEEMVHPQLH